MKYIRVLSILCIGGVEFNEGATQVRAQRGSGQNSSHRGKKVNFPRKLSY